MPDKPAEFCDFSQQDVRGGDVSVSQRQSQSSGVQQIPPAGVPNDPVPQVSAPVPTAAPNVPAPLQPQQQQAAASTGAGQIVIKYPDGREEVIDVINIDSVRRAAKAEQVLPSLSFPETVFLQPLKTNSSPAIPANAPVVDVDAAIPPVILPAIDDDEKVVEPKDDDVPVQAGDAEPDVLQAVDDDEEVVEPPNEDDNAGAAPPQAV